MRLGSKDGGVVPGTVGSKGKARKGQAILATQVLHDFVWDRENQPSVP